MVVVYKLYSSPNIILVIKPRKMRWAGHVVRMGKKRDAKKIFGGKTREKEPLARPKRR